MSKRAMMKGSRVFFCLFLACMALPLRAEPVKRAVLIGVDEYKSESISDLRGCGNDADLMKSVLVGKFDFAPGNVKVLKSEQATRDGIISTIRSHLGQSEAGDIALVHYSGHGSQMKDRSGDEADGKDETIVPHDSRQGGIFDISDDEINGLMREISEKTPNLVFILDSCHSGTAARAAMAGNIARQAPADDREPPEPESWAMGARGIEEGADGIRLPGANYVLISGCRANELSNEAVFGGARQGAMTYFLARALDAATEKTTYRDVMEQVKADVNAKFVQQHPQLEGTGTDTRIFGADRILPRPYVLVEPDGAGAASVQAGKVLGVTAGTELKVFEPGTKTFDKPDEATATVRVVTVENFESTATIVDGTVAPHSRAVLERVSPPAYRATLFVHDLESSAILEQVADSLAGDEAIEIVDDLSAAELRLAIEGEGDGAEAVLRGRELQVLSRAAAGANAATKVADQIRHWARWFGLLAIDNPGGGDLPMDFRIERASAAPGEAAPEIVSPGDQVRIRVTNLAETQKVYLTLLDFRRTGEVVVLHPTDVVPEPMEPGESWEAVFPAGIPEGLDEDVDIIKAIFTTEELPRSVFTLGAAPRAAGVEGPLERYLRLYNQGKRALGPAIQAAGWTTQKRVLRVRRPGFENRGFIAHFETAETAAQSGQTLTRSLEDRAEPGFAGDGTMVLLSTPLTRGERTDERVSVGDAFGEAYELRKRACAADPDACPARVEPLLELDIERSQSAPLAAEEGTRGLPETSPLPEAEGDVLWSHKYTRVPEAWALLRADGKPAGNEAAGVLIAHPDTGYLPHPEIWEPAAERPILADRGWDYLDEDDEPLDRTEKERLLANPVHGTGSSSAIISRAGCQLAGAQKCPTGVAQGAHLVPLRINDSVINFSGKRLAQALLDASGSDRTRIKEDTDLAAIAMGGPPSWALWKAVREAEKRGFLVITAAGNYVRTVVWPARWESTIAVAAVNAHCEPWAHSSRGDAVDIAAPGESVWRATINEQETQITGMGTGTTYGTATTGGIVALWVAKHKGTAAWEALKTEGKLTQALRQILAETAWQPGGDRVPPAAKCAPGATWNEGKYGVGIIDAAALLEAPLPAPADVDLSTRAVGDEVLARDVDSLEQLPLWSSLYPSGTELSVIEADYRQLFADGDAELESIAIYEAEILYHYTTNESLAEAIDEVALQGNRGDLAYARIRDLLKVQDLSTDLRSALQ